MILIPGFLYLLLGFVADVVAWTLPESREAGYLGPSALEGAVLEVDEPEDLVRARRLLDSLAEGADPRPFPYHLFLIDEPDPNAVAMPGGGIGLTRGLLDRVESDIGLATVLGHELGHHQGRHNLRLLGRAILSRMVIALLFDESGSAMAEVPLFPAESGYPRRQEAEADEFALRLINDHFGHTRGSLEFFELIREEFGAGTHHRGAFLSTHPLTAYRIEPLREMQRELDAAPGNDNR